MTYTCVSLLAQRIIAIDWNSSDENFQERVNCIREFLRRSAQWARRMESPAWPFFDVAEQLNPTIRASAQTVDEVLQSIPMRPSTVADTCVWALHFAALRDAGEIPSGLLDPYETLIDMYELGGGFSLDGTGAVEIDLRTMPLKKLEDWIDRPPFV
ncbi:hypothetical protein ACF082_23945 [Streptomyces lydicus]|uniref:hypothetical protein n=1 Tax=Streptomyces lydicus TaxID=47763 RepID=UPI0037004BFE